MSADLAALDRAAGRGRPRRRRRGGRRGRRRRRQPVDRGPRRRAGACRARRGRRPRAARADRPAPGLRLGERHPARDHRGDGRARGRHGARGARGPLLRPRRSGDARRATGTSPRSTSSTPSRCPAPRRCRRRRWTPRRRRWRCPASARWTRPARAGRRAHRTSRPRTASPAATAAPATRVHAVAICGEGLAHGARLRLRGPHPPRRPARPAEVGRLAGERAAARAGASKPPTGAFRSSTTSGSPRGLIGHLVQAINGARSPAARAGSRTRWASGCCRAGIDLVEDPLRPRIAGSRPFDGEGLPAARRVLVEDGILKSWTLDLATAPPARPRRAPATPAAAPRRRRRPSAGNLTLTPGHGDARRR